ENGLPAAGGFGERRIQQKVATKIEGLVLHVVGAGKLNDRAWHPKREIGKGQRPTPEREGSGKAGDHARAVAGRLVAFAALTQCVDLPLDVDVREPCLVELESP